MDKDSLTDLQTVAQSIRIISTPSQVWTALLASWAGEKWRNAHFETDWQVGSPIKISTMIGDERYDDVGHVLRMEPCELLQYAHWSRVSGLPDTPTSYAIITFRLSSDGGQVLLKVEHQVPSSPIRQGDGWIIGPESGLKHAEFYWRSTLPILKRVVEERVARPQI